MAHTSHLMTQESYHQPELFDGVARRTPPEVHRLLIHGTGVPPDVQLVVTRNRVSMISLAFKPSGGVKIRMHEAFLGAPEEVLQALRRYIRTRNRDAWRAVAAFAQGIDGGPSTATRARRLRAKGRHFDLSEIAQEVNATFFDGKIHYRIGWGRGRPRMRRRGMGGRSMRMGSWHASTREVRIHPLLDDERVPPEFMRYLVYHELLHAVVPSVKRAGGRRDHPAEFRLLERRFPEIRRMHRLAGELVDKLLNTG